MNSFQWIEIAFILGIIFLQVNSFLKTYKLRLTYVNIFPGDDQFRIQRYMIPKSELLLAPKDLFTRLDMIYKPDTGEELLPDYVIVEIISQKTGGNYVTSTILKSLNTYLVRNKGVASDFHLIKDVVERNCDAVEAEINQTVSLPLYFGLLGTFLGIIIGLLQMSGVSTSDPEKLDTAVSLLLVGVEIAMCASFFGLLLTVINNVTFRKSKAVLENRKNNFYTFLQTELMPLLNQSINSNLFSFQNSIHRFNAEFTENVARLRSVVTNNYEALVAQAKVLNALENMDITSLANANVNILKTLQVTIDRLSTFNNYLKHSNDLAHQTGLVAERVQGVLERTDHLGEVAQQVLGVFEENKQMTAFLQSHYNSLDNSHQLINKAVSQVGSTLHESLEQLKAFTQEQIAEIQKITIQEISLMSEQYPERWKNLDELQYLEKMSKDLNEMKMSTAGQIESMRQSLISIIDSINKIQLELKATKPSLVQRFRIWMSEKV